MSLNCFILKWFHYFFSLKCTALVILAVVFTPPSSNTKFLPCLFFCDVRLSVDAAVLYYCSEWPNSR